MNPYKEGYDAFYANISWQDPKEFTPYYEESDEGKLWFEGYYDAHMYWYDSVHGEGV